MAKTKRIRRQRQVETHVLRCPLTIDLSVNEQRPPSTAHLRPRDSKEPAGKEKTRASTLNRTVLPDYDGVVYTLDAKLIGNIGRYFNHSCSPNIAVQNVFVDVGIFSDARMRISIVCLDARYSLPMDRLLRHKEHSSRHRAMVGNTSNTRLTTGCRCLSSWDYNYTVGEIAGRRLDCNCGSSECRRRVL